MKKSRAKKKLSENRHTIASLKEENRILRAELKRLDRALRIHSVSRSGKKISSEKKRETKTFEAAQNAAVSLASSSYLKYILARVSSASVYYVLRKIISGFRKIKLVSTTIKIISSILAILSTGAFFIFVSGTVIFFIPISILLCAATYLTGMLFRKKAFRLLESKMNSKDILVFFPSIGRPFQKGSYFQKILNSVSHETDNNAIIIVVSPYLISFKGFGGGGYYPVMRLERPNIYLIRKNAFFALRRKLLHLHSERISYIY